MGKKQFTCLWINNAQAYLQEKVFSKDELALLFMASALLMYRDTTIRNLDGRPASKSDMADIMGCSVATVKRTIVELKKKNAVRTVGKHFHLNPSIAWKGLAQGKEYLDATEAFSLPYKERRSIEIFGDTPDKVRKRMITDKFGHRIPILRGSHMNPNRVTGEPLDKKTHENIGENDKKPP